MLTFKKVLVLLTVISVLLCGLCACGGTDTPDNSSTDGTTTAPTESQIVIPTFTSKPADNGKVTYTVTVVDQNGNPVAGVSIQFCDDENCKMPSDTDANGVVTQSYKPSNYHITIAALPDGYTAEETVFYFGENTELTVVITAP